jgi:hypothetical protein
VDEPIDTARKLLSRLRHAFPAELPALADELLVFLYRLKDEYVIVHSSSRMVTGSSFAVLSNLIYSLESAPEAALRETSTVEFLRALLEDLTRGAVVIQKKNSSQP